MHLKPQFVTFRERFKATTPGITESITSDKILEPTSNTVNTQKGNWNEFKIGISKEMEKINMDERMNMRK